MIEGAANELPEAEFVKALHFAQSEVTKIVAAQEELAKLAGKAKREVPLMLVKDELLEIAYEIAGDRIEGALYSLPKLPAARPSAL
jgi:polyribonucleotide nucleotidyltransferase